MACCRAPHQEVTEKTSSVKGHESTVSAIMSDDDAVCESSGMVAGSDVVPLAAEIIAVAGVAGGVVVIVAGPQMAPHSVVVAAVLVVGSVVAGSGVVPLAAEIGAVGDVVVAGVVGGVVVIVAGPQMAPHSDRKGVV